MKKPYGRKTRQRVGAILQEHDRAKALALLTRIPDEQLTGHLFFYFYNKDELIKFRSVTAMGELVLRLAQDRMEKARIVLRRIMWNLNDESGGIGWGSPEAMGEILGKSPELAEEFKSILFSYLDTRANHIEHEVLQRGVLWGIGTYLEAAPQDLDKTSRELIFSFLDSDDVIKQGYAIRALVNGQCLKIVSKKFLDNFHKIKIYDGWNFETLAISDIIV